MLQIWEVYQIMCDGDVYHGPRTSAQHFTQLLREHTQRNYTEMIYHRRILISLIQSAQREKQIRNMAPAEKICEALTFAARGIILTWSIEDGTFDLAERMKPVIELILAPEPGFEICK